MKAMFLCLIICVLAGIRPLECAALNGAWRGELDMRTAKLPLVFNFKEDAAGKTTATMDSPLQNATGLPLQVLYCSADSVSVKSAQLGMSYRGALRKGKIFGTFYQLGHSFALELAPEERLIDRRPQTPQPPFPYSEQEVTFESADGTLLAGTLTLPDHTAATKVPVVVMVTGSGPQNRDEEIFEHRPFAVIADYLARRGIASLRYDDRGVASSQGDFQAATIDTFKVDAQSALRFVKGMPQAGKVGILGHSEGGAIAALIAADGEPDFIVSLAGVVTPARSTLLEQNIRALDSFGITGSGRESSIKLLEILFETIAGQQRTGEKAPVDIDLMCRENSLDVPAVVLESIKHSNQSRNDYFDSLVCLDPSESLGKIKCPVLAINGSKDVQVNPDTNLKAFSTVPGAIVRRMEGLNHLQQHATTGELTEYGDIRETISPEVLEIIAGFISGL